MKPIKTFRVYRKALKRLLSYERRFSTIEANMENLVNEKFSFLNQGINQSYKSFLAQKEFSVKSQNGEDGLLLFILSEIGIKHRKFIEFGIGNGTECNSANLITNFGWSALLIEGDKAKSTFASSVYKDYSVEVVNTFITKENINAIFERSGYTEEVDILSIDIDGNDYWVWEAIDIVDPRIVVIEYNGSLGPNQSLTVEYDPAFSRYEKHESGWYHGASLQALFKLGDKKGYNLIGCDSSGVNAFFVRKDIPLNQLKACSAEEVYYNERKRTKLTSQPNQFERVNHLPFVEIK